jgi:hypothetical protein
VTVLDTNPELVPAATELKGPCVVIMDIRDKGIEATLESLVVANADVRILAWTDVAGAVAESVLDAAGVSDFRVLPRTATEIELVDAVRRLSSM